MSSSSAPPPPPPRNLLALISLVLAVLAPALAIIALGATLVHATGMANGLAGILGQITVPVSLAAIICGHLALSRVKRYPPPQAWRGFALSGLLLGYVLLAAFVVFLVRILATFQ